jgi:hypothetical protein
MIEIILPSTTKIGEVIEIKGDGPWTIKQPESIIVIDNRNGTYSHEDTHIEKVEK